MSVKSFMARRSVIREAYGADNFAGCGNCGGLFSSKGDFHRDNCPSYDPDEQLEEPPTAKLCVRCSMPIVKGEAHTLVVAHSECVGATALGLGYGGVDSNEIGFEMDIDGRKAIIWPRLTST